MARFENNSLPEGAPGGVAGDRWLFPKTIMCVVGAFAVLAFLLSPALYIKSLRDTPKAWAERAEKHLEEKEFDEAIEDYNRVLSFEEERLRIFVLAENNIRKIQQLKKLREQEGVEGGEEEAAETGEEEGPPGKPDEAADEDEADERPEASADADAGDDKPSAGKPDEEPGGEKPPTVDW